MSEQETPLERILALVERATRSGQHYKSLCPAHADKNPSLAIKEGEEGQVLLYCHAGCDTEDILTQLGLTMRDLYPSNGAKLLPQLRLASDQGGRGGIAATYSYRDAEGTLLYEVMRSETKQFRQRRPDSRGGYAWDLQGVPRVLYRLPQLARADAADGPGETCRVRSRLG